MVNSLKRFKSWIEGLLSSPSKVFDEEEYRAAYQYKDSFIPKDGCDYSWVADYARFNFDQFQQADETLDKKAESIMRILGGGTGLLSLGAVLNLSKIGMAPSIAIAIGLVLALCAVIVAAWVRVPRNTMLPPSIAWALEYVASYESSSQQRFLAQWHLACEGIRLSLRAKAWGVKVATWLGVCSVAAVAISFFVALANMDSSLVTQPQGIDMNKPADSSANPKQNTPNTPSSVPDPSAVSQTPHSIAGSQTIQKSADPAKDSGPQTIQFSREASSNNGDDVRVRYNKSN